jgi:hypothetical protein
VFLLPLLESFNFVPLSAAETVKQGLILLLLRASRNGHFKYGGQAITLKKP